MPKLIVLWKPYLFQRNSCLWIYIKMKLPLELLIIVGFFKIQTSSSWQFPFQNTINVWTSFPPSIWIHFISWLCFLSKNYIKLRKSEIRWKWPILFKLVYILNNWIIARSSYCSSVVALIWLYSLILSSLRLPTRLISLTWISGKILCILSTHSSMFNCFQLIRNCCVYHVSFVAINVEILFLFSLLRL